MPTITKSIRSTIQHCIGLITAHFQLLIILTFSSMLFSPALGSFFSGDDWFHLQVVQISTLQEFFNFFNPVFNPQSIAFYRPIPSQLFFFVFNQLFGLWSFPYYLFIFILFLTSVVLLYAVLLKSNFDKATTLIATAIFSFSHTNFTRINFISAAQEVMMSCFLLIALLVNQKIKQKLGGNLLIAFIFGLALLCKENAIVFPLLVLFFDWLGSKKVHLQKMLLLSAVSVIYLFTRFVVFQSPMLAIDTYVLNFSPRLAANTLYFYGIWAVGGAEFLQDYLATPIQLIDRYNTDFGRLGTILIVLLALNICSLIVLFVFSKKKKHVLMSALLFVLTLSPVLFLPFHKFTIQMTIPMMCFAVCVAILCKQKTRRVITLVLALLLALNATTLYLTSRSHYTVQRAQISKKIYTYFTEKYPIYPENSYFVLTNASTPGSNIAEWGSSKQISLALWGSGFVKVFYKNPEAEMLYEDIPFTRPMDKQPIYLDSALFLK